VIIIEELVLKGHPWPSGYGCWLQTTCSSSLWVQIPVGTLDSFMRRSYPASLRNVGGSTQMPVIALNNAWKDTWGLPPPVYMERRHMNYTVSVWRKTQSIEQANIQMHDNSGAFVWRIMLIIIISFSENQVKQMFIQCYIMAINTNDTKDDIQINSLLCYLITITIH
jgi:hypothetical protein